MSKKVQKSGKCIFCGGERMSKQHVLPNWLGEYFPKKQNDVKVQRLVYIEKQQESMKVQPVIRKKQGHLGTLKIRNVCQNCNNGWMSKLEESVKPIVENLIKGQVVGLSKKDQDALTRWVILVNIMIEYTDEKTMAIPSEDRKILMEGGIPNGWVVWIGYCNSDNWNFRYKHNGAAVMTESDYKAGNKIPKKCNIQFTTIGIGCLYIHAIKSCLDYIPMISHSEEIGLLQIHPYQKDIPILRIPKYIGDIDAETIPDFIYMGLINGKSENEIKNIFVDLSKL